jgi:pimeloyl-ACP methyl ester carboxylesterase
MSNHLINGIKIEIETRGADDAPAFLLIRGLSTQLIQWPEAFLQTLVEAGFRVIVFDNRDCGLSQKFDEAGTPSIPDLLSGKMDAPYRIADMAKDAVGVLDHLGIQSAHAAGISLGGMVVQHLAFSHGHRFDSITSIMSTSGAPGLPSGTPEAIEALTSQPSDPTDRECVILHGMKTQKVISSPSSPPTEAELRSYVERAYDRCHCPDGAARQLAAVLTDGSRVDDLSRIDLPFLVIHGEADPLIPLACGEDTANQTPGAKLVVIPGMGHDITTGNSPIVTQHLIDHARQSRGGSATE